MKDKKNKHKHSASQIPITPETKIGILLDSYPELESILIQMAPSFGKLTNPLLRKTIAKITSLKQAAEIGQIPLPALINRLRKEVGQEDWTASREEDEKKPQPKPDWLKTSSISKTIDARPMLERGEHPVNLVLQELSELQQNKCLLLITSFEPAPLKDLAHSKGFKTWTEKKSEQLYQTFFGK